MLGTYNVPFPVGRILFIRVISIYVNFLLLALVPLFFFVKTWNVTCYKHVSYSYYSLV